MACVGQVSSHDSDRTRWCILIMFLCVCVCLFPGCCHICAIITQVKFLGYIFIHIQTDGRFFLECVYQELTVDGGFYALLDSLTGGSGEATRHDSPLYIRGKSISVIHLEDIALYDKVPYS